MSKQSEADSLDTLKPCAFSLVEPDTVIMYSSLMNAVILMS